METLHIKVPVKSIMNTLTVRLKALKINLLTVYRLLKNINESPLCPLKLFCYSITNIFIVSNSLIMSLLTFKYSLLVEPAGLAHLEKLKCHDELRTT